MAGSISFTLTGNATEMVAATVNAQRAMAGLKITVADINSAFDAAARKASGPSAAEFKSAARSINSAIAGIASQAAMFAGPTAQSLVYPVLFFGKELKTLSATMKALKITAYEAGGTVAGLIAIIATWSSAYGAAKAALNATATENATVETLNSMANQLMEQIVELAQKGKLGKEEAINLQVKLTLAPNSIEKLAPAVRAVQDRLREIVGVAPDKDALTQLNRLEAELRVKSKTGRDRAIAELDLEIPDLINKASALAEKSKQEFGPIKALIDAYGASRVQQINEQFSPRVSGDAGFRAPDNLTGLERIGLVLNGGGGGSNDHARSTADNTRALVTEARRTNQLLSSGGGNSFGNL